MRSLFVVSLLLAAACSELKSADPATDQSPNDPAAIDPATAAKVETICDPYCAWRDRCGSQAPAECDASCRREFTGRMPHLLPTYVGYVARCFTTLECSGIDDQCIDSFAAVNPNPDQVPEVSSCLAAKNSCPHGPSGDACYFLAVVDAPTRAASAACFAGVCDDVNICLRHARGD